MIRALICDLDNTLFSPSSLPRDILQPVIDAVLSGNVGPDRVDEAVLHRALEEGWRRPFDAVAREYALPPWVLETWMRINQRLEVATPLEPFPDVEHLWRTAPRRFLVTTGFRRFQESKVRALGFDSRFEDVIIDAVDDPVRIGKEHAFRGILGRCALSPAEVLVLGDSGESELAVGGQLGMTTVQVLRDGVEPAPHASFRISSCEALPGILTRLETASA